MSLGLHLCTVTLYSIVQKGFMHVPVTGEPNVKYGHFEKVHQQTKIRSNHSNCLSSNAVQYACVLGMVGSS